MKQALRLSLLIIIAIVAAFVFFYVQNSNIKPLIINPPVMTDTPAPEQERPLSDGQNNTDFPLMVPEGFTISIFASSLGQPRSLAIDGQGNMWVSQMEQGMISRLTIENGEVSKVETIFTGLKRPHGLAIDPQNNSILYIAEENKVSKVSVDPVGQLEKIADLPTGGRHVTRSLQFGADNRLYVSIGSTCDVCDERDDRHGTVIVMDKDGDNQEIFARGLRNAVYLAVNPISGEIWTTEMGRDFLGDDIPPDEINILRRGADYGWPICYGNNIHDTKFDTNQYIQDPCADKESSHIDLPAHSAPLGLAFVPEEGWPENMWHDLIVAYHGSWNRTDPTGYKLTVLELDDAGRYRGTHDFITGWLREDDTAYGRPAGLLIQPGGIMYVTDDKAGMIYRVTFSG